MATRWDLVPVSLGHSGSFGLPDPLPRIETETTERDLSGYRKDPKSKRETFYPNIIKDLDDWSSRTFLKQDNCSTIERRL